ncbi:DUF2063 domain-containing protein [uncultured Azohydromonas sp.]|mgnify:CR=1 FL=1|jgi:Uncharacterized protein conserved in bacteria (DUF2063).|uniref:HvfC/BufC N-terminal domain-containing protein n=1 Tax=uncultured Azohydromonas sp. TaxID=487342 RepID=UPI0026377C72|nr:DNA-binding domain-containing protein [uncultured Azohydromonas sp.]
MPAALHEIQRQVMHALLQRGDATAAAALLRPTPGLDAARRLQLYRNNCFESLSAALGAVYPVVRQLVGDAFFRALARRFIPAFPSRSGNLHDFGAELSEFLRGFEPATSLPYLPDVAALEWACHAVYHEAPVPALSLDALAALDADQQAALRLKLQPCARLLASEWPVLDLWRAHQGNAEDALEAIDWHGGGTRLLVAQRELEVEFRLLGVGEYAWLRALHDGEALAAACGLALVADPGFELPAVLMRHLELGSFCALDHTSSAEAPRTLLRHPRAGGDPGGPTPERSKGAANQTGSDWGADRSATGQLGGRLDSRLRGNDEVVGEAAPLTACTSSFPSSTTPHPALQGDPS